MIRAAAPLLVIAAVWALAACGGYQAVAPVGERSAMPVPKGPYYTVRRGDTLYAIAWATQQDYRAIAAWNGLRPPYVIQPGQRLRITAPPAQARATVPRERTPPPVPKPPVPKKTEPPVRSGPIQWQWPTAGPVLRRYNAQATGRKGIDIGGRPGQPVRAAAGGKVVYSGDGLIGYGNLVIVKHDDRYLSAYGNNRRALVQEDDTVRAGQPIAELGTGSGSGGLLYFEIRRDGEPVDPSRYVRP